MSDNPQAVGLTTYRLNVWHKGKDGLYMTHGVQILGQVEILGPCKVTVFANQVTIETKEQYVKHIVDARREAKRLAISNAQRVE